MTWGHKDIIELEGALEEPLLLEKLHQKNIPDAMVALYYL
jgi:6,7-dimethyl-8-ribityllumazine synthase